MRKAGNQVRISTQLIEANTDTSLWSETYDRRLEDIFSVQDEIAAAVVEKLKLELLGPSLIVEETDPEAYARYLQANYLTNIGAVESVRTAITLYKEVVAANPNYVPGWIGLSTAYDHLAALRALPGEEGRTLSLQAIEHAEKLAPNSPSVHSHLAWRLFRYSNDLQGAAHHFQRALDLETANVNVISNIAVFLTALGRLEEGVQFAEYAADHDPANALGYNNLGTRYRFAGEYGKAKSAFLDCLRLSPEFGGPNYDLGATLLLTGQNNAAMKSFQAEPLAVFSQIGLAMGYFAEDNPDLSEELLNRLITDHGDEIPYFIAQVMAFRREPDLALSWLERARHLGDRELLNVINEPFFDNLKGDPRWLRFLESIGLSPTQLAAIEFTPSLPQSRSARDS